LRRRSFLGLLLLPALCAAALSGCDAAGSPGLQRTFTANGTKLWYEVRGELGKTPLIAISGGPGFDHTYLLASDVWDRLARRRPVVLYDQRGTGRSEPFSPGHTLADHVADLEALRVELRADEVDLAGHSWGGYLGLAYAIQYPQHTRHLVLCGSAAPRLNDTLILLDAHFPDVMERYAAHMQALQTSGDQAAGKAALRELVGALFVSAEKRDEFLSKNEGLHLNHAMNAALETAIGDHDMWPAVRELRVPTLVLNGRFDTNVGPETAWKLHKAIAGSRIHFFERSGHFPFVEEPDAFAELVEGFLDGR
jgi:proline iminopeptidase